MRTLAALLVLSAAAPAFAHDVSRSDSKIEIQGREVRVTLTLNVKELLNPAIPLESFNPDRDVDLIFNAIRTHFSITSPASPANARLEGYSVPGGSLIRLRILYTFDQPVTAL